MSILVASLIWNTAIDWFAQIGFLFLSRMDETEADLYAVKKGYGYALRSALIRNFGLNLDNIYFSRLDTILSSSHATILQRIATIDHALYERRKRKREAERAITQKGK